MVRDPPPGADPFAPDPEWVALIAALEPCNASNQRKTPVLENDRRTPSPIMTFEGSEEHWKAWKQKLERLRQIGEWHLKEANRLHSRPAGDPSNHQVSKVAEIHLRAAETVCEVVTDLEMPSVRHDQEGYSEYLKVRERMLQRLRQLREWHLQEARRHDPKPPPNRNRSQESGLRSMADFHERAVETLAADAVDLQVLMGRECDKEKLKTLKERHDRLHELRAWHEREARRFRLELVRNHRNEKAIFHDRAAEALYDGAVDLEYKDVVIYR